MNACSVDNVKFAPTTPPFGFKVHTTTQAVKLSAKSITLYLVLVQDDPDNLTAPDGGTLGNPLGSSNPYGAARWSKYWKCSSVVASFQKDEAYVVEGDGEILHVRYVTASSDADVGFVVGAFILPPSNAEGEASQAKWIRPLGSKPQLQNAPF